MPKHTKKARNAKNNTVTVRPFILKTENQEYAKVTKLFGDCRVECECYDKKVRMGIIRNKMRRGKNNKVTLGSIVIVSLREYQDSKADIIHVYNLEETTRLRKMKIIPKDTSLEDTDEVFKFSNRDTSSDEEENEESEEDIDLSNI